MSKKNNKNALGGAVGRQGGAPPDTFSQFVARQPGVPRHGGVAGNAFAPPLVPNNPPPATGAGVVVADPANAFAPPAHAPFDPALFAAFMRHKYWMDNAANRGDDPARYGAGPLRTMAF